MDEVGLLFFAAWILAATVGAVNNVFFQTADEKIVRMCRDHGYLNVGQERIKCVLEETVDVKKDTIKR